MTFSKPTYVGEISTGIQSPYGGYIIKGATQNNGDYFTKWRKDGKYYGKGIAVFGKGNDALYCHYDYYAQIAPNSKESEKFGSRDLSNTIDVGIWHGGSINKIDTNEGITLYAIRFNYCTSFITLIGRTKDGKWIKYFDTRDISNRYGIKWGYKEDGGIFYEYAKTDGDTIIIPYHRWHWSGESKTEGEFRFKWDDKAQWFGVEHIAY